MTFVLSDSQFAQQPESHLGQMDVNDLLSKLISTGIIKPATTDSSQTGERLPQISHICCHRQRLDNFTQPCVLLFPETTAAPASPPPAEEEEEEEHVDDDIPDLTSFSLDDMKQCVLL